MNLFCWPVRIGRKNFKYIVRFWRWGCGDIVIVRFRFVPLPSP